MRTLLATCVALAFAGCTHRENIERKDPLNDQVTGALMPSDRAFMKDDPATRVSCRADADCPQGAMCHPQRKVCFTSYPDMKMTSVSVSCPLVPLYFMVDSTELVPQAQKWIDHDVACLKARGSKSVTLTGYADVRGDPASNVILSRKRADAVKQAMSQRGLDINVSVEGDGSSSLIPGTSEHDYAYNRRVELQSKEK